MARSQNTGLSSKLGVLPTGVLIVAILYIARDVLIPISVAILLAFLLTPAVTWLERRRVGRIFSIILVMAAALAALGTITWVLEHQFVEVVSRLPNYRDNIQQKFGRIRADYQDGMAKVAAEIETTFKGAENTNPSTSPPASAPMTPSGTSSFRPDTNSPGQGQNLLQQYSEPWSLPEMLGSYSGLVLSPLATTGLILIFAFFILVNRRDLRDRILRLAGDSRLHVTTQALDDAANRITHYLLMQTAINAAYGICIGIGLWIIGACSAEGRFPNVLLWALLAMLMRFLPYLGPWIGAALPLLLSLVLFSSASVFIATAGLYVGLEIVTSNFLEPWLYASSTGMSAVAVLASAVFWTWLWGLVGLLLSTPLTVCLVVLGKYVPHLQFLAVMLGDEQALDPSFRTYQRLLSLDQDDAGQLLDKYQKEHGLQRVYDEVMVPALAMAEADRQSGTLDTDRELFVYQAMRDLVEELADTAKKQNAPPAIAHETMVTVICLPANSAADEIVGLMLANLLELKGQPAIAASATLLAGEMLELIQAQKAAVVCISALPPAAVAHSRYLGKRLHAKFPELPTLVGLWTSNADPKALMARLAGDQSVRLATGLSGALDEIHQLVQPLLLQHAG